MKITFVALALFLLSFGACTQKTCPTYTKDSIKKTETAVKDLNS